MILHYDKGMFVECLPFFSLVLAIATLPYYTPQWWHRFYWAIPGLCLALLGLIGYQMATLGPLLSNAADTLVDDYLPFISLIGALYIVSGGIRIDTVGKTISPPWFNTLFLGFAGILAGWIGTTAAAMIFIRPFLHLYENRIHKTHVMVFFIILVANVGGAQSPLGDPPLLIGFLKGIPFFWPARHLFAATLLTMSFILLLYLFFDTIFYNKETSNGSVRIPRFRIMGRRNLVFIAGILALIVSSTLIAMPKGILILGLVLLACASLHLTPSGLRVINGFKWQPLGEIACLFLGLFLTILPVIDWLATTSLHTLSPRALFWLSGLLSTFLDNAPTYLVFFEGTLLKPEQLLTTHMPSLIAISLGTVFMGSLTYIGNAPNLMVQSIALHRGIPVPSFFRYSLYASLILGPCLLAIHFMFLE